MPGIVGLVTNSGESANLAAVDRMLHPLRRSPLHHESSISSHTAALGAIGLPEGGPEIAAKDGVWLAHYGLIVDDAFTADLQSGAYGPPGDCGAPARLLLDRFLRGGVEAVCGLNGLYALAIWEEEPQRLTLVLDRLAYFNLYYWQSPDGLMFGSEYKSIAWHPQFPRAVDPVAVSDLFLHFSPMEDRTLFRGIHSLPAAGLLVYEKGQLSVRSYWLPSFSAPNKAGDERHYADGLAEHMRRSLARRARPGSSLLVTGGLDSRIVAEMYPDNAWGDDLVTSTIGVPGGDDLVYGKKIAQVLNLPHEHIAIGTDYLEQFTPPITWSAEGKIGAHGSWIMAQGQFLQQRGLRYALTGLFGNFVSGRHYAPGIHKAASFAEGRRLANSYIYHGLAGLRDVMRPEIFSEAAMYSVDMPGRMFDHSGASDARQAYDYMLMHSRIARGGHTSDALGDYALALEPFLDNDVINYALQEIPYSVRERGMFYLLLITRHLPRVTKIPYARTGFSISQDLRIRQVPLLHHVDNLRRRALRRIFPARYDKERRGCIPHAGAFRGGSMAFARQALARSDYLGDLFDMHAVNRMLEDHIAGRRNAYMTLSHLVTFSIWCEQFC